MKTKVFLCPKCSCSNAFNFDDSIETIKDLNVDWLICNHCFKISDIGEWIKVNNSVLMKSIYFRNKIN